MSEKKKMTISTYDDLIEYGLLVCNKLDDDVVVEFDENLAFNVRIEGSNWDDKFDQRSAAIVLDVYNSLKNVYKELNKKDKNIILLKPETRLIAETKSGSLDLFIFLKDLIGDLWKMSSEQLKIVCAAIAGIYIGGLSIKKIFEQFTHRNTLLHNEKMKEKEIAERNMQLESSNKQLIEILNNNKIILQEAQKPFLALKEYMTVNDKIYIPSNAEPLNKAEVSEMYAIEEENIIETETLFYIDNKFRVIERKHVSDNVATIIDIETKKRISNVILEVDDNDRANISLHLDNKDEIELQVTISITNDKKIKKASIIGIGSPRQNTVKLKDILL